MTTPAHAIKPEIRLLIDVQIETLRQPAPIPSPQLHEYHHRSEKLRALSEELDRIGSTSAAERRMEVASEREGRRCDPHHSRGVRVQQLVARDDLDRKFSDVVAGFRRFRKLD
jgi:hypothetical protein